MRQNNLLFFSKLIFRINRYTNHVKNQNLCKKKKQNKKKVGTVKLYKYFYIMRYRVTIIKRF